jgi:hypothetical protein
LGAISQNILTMIFRNFFVTKTIRNLGFEKHY